MPCHLVRGVRNNNPGNVRGVRGALGFQGFDADGFGIYDTTHNGIRICALIVLNAQRLHGCNTVNTIVRRYSATDQGAYALNVAAALGIGTEDVFDFATDHHLLFHFVKAVIRQENGFDPYDDDTIGAACADALFHVECNQ